MMKLHELSPAPGSVKERKRIGRGAASGQGKTCLLYTSDAADDLMIVYISVVAVSLKKIF